MYGTYLNRQGKWHHQNHHPFNNSQLSLPPPSLHLTSSPSPVPTITYHHANHFVCSKDDQFGGAGGLLKGSAQRLQQVVTAAGSDRKCMCYMVVGLVTVFFVLYYGFAWIKT
jgi:hypothetical protein